MHIKFIGIIILTGLALVACNRKPASIARNIYIDTGGAFLYIVDDKYAKENYSIKRQIVHTISYELKDGKFIYDDMMGKVILDISDDHSRIQGTCGVLQLDLRKTDVKDASPEAKTLLGL